MLSYNKYITHKILGKEIAETRRVRYLIFLRDVLLLTITSFGGAQAHLTLFLNTFVAKRKYLTEKDLVELNSFCHILPGPASTQIITAIGFKLGGYRLAWLTLLVWILPTTLLMILAAISISWLQRHNISINFTRFIQPMAVAFVAWSAYKISSHSVQTRTSHVIFVIAAIASYFIRWPGVFPALLIIGGCITSIRFKKHPKEEKSGISLSWKSLLIYSIIFFGAAFIGHLTDYKPIRLFENFFRNGSIVFGGGHPLSALLYKEFVQFKNYLSAEEFLSGFALQQAFPGPIFCFTAFIGALSMREYGLWGEVGGGFVATAGIFLPGTLFIFFMINIWEKLKKYRVVKASLEGINAASAGIVTATALLLFNPLTETEGTAIINLSIFFTTLLTLFFTRFPPPYIIMAGLTAGLIF